MVSHTRIVAILHIAFSLLSTVITSVLLSVAGFTTFMPGPNTSEFLVKLSVVAFVVRIGLAAAQIIGGIALLKGKSVGRFLITTFGVLDLFIIPVGTALGIYTLWALVRKQPAMMPYALDSSPDL